MKTLALLSLLALSTSALAADYYQAGTKWDKAPLDLTKLASYSPGIQKLALATGKHLAGGEQAGGTVFYLGKFTDSSGAGHHLMATNHHVFPWGCRDEKVRLAGMNHAFTCTWLWGTWQEVDTTIFEVSVPASDEEYLAKIALRFAPKKLITNGLKLANIGYGDNLNPQSLPMVDESNDCFVISPTNDFQFTGDPEEGWDSNFKVWSFAHACEASHGDSGSPVADRETGEVVGLIWGTAAPKLPRIQDTDYLVKLSQGAAGTEKDDVWHRVNYAVAVPRLFDYIMKHVGGERSAAEEALHPESRFVLGQFLKSYGL